MNNAESFFYRCLSFSKSTAYPLSSIIFKLISFAIYFNYVI